MMLRDTPSQSGRSKGEEWEFWCILVADDKAFLFGERLRLRYENKSKIKYSNVQLSEFLRQKRGFSVLNADCETLRTGYQPKIVDRIQIIVTDEREAKRGTSGTKK
ncbi:hypothetical protein PUN28_011642 [Cardiocondyla obscurior]|uniref:LAGLIDADG homing endonuclease n=1 Tax=Cardiocondyla obscurior TaxID=286306 RepID=A0AAW2FHG2_9HYME